MNKQKFSHTEVKNMIGMGFCLIAVVGSITFNLVQGVLMYGI